MLTDCARAANRSLRLLKPEVEGRREELEPTLVVRPRPLIPYEFDEKAGMRLNPCGLLQAKLIVGEAMCISLVPTPETSDGFGDSGHRRACAREEEIVGADARIAST